MKLFSHANPPEPPRDEYLPRDEIITNILKLRNDLQADLNTHVLAVDVQTLIARINKCITKQTT